MTPSIYRTTAQRIANSIQKEPSVPHPTLTGLISDCTKKHTTEPRLKLKSLQDKIKDKPAPYNNTPRMNSKMHAAAATSSGTGHTLPEIHQTKLLPIQEVSNNTPRFPPSELINNSNTLPAPQLPTLDSPHHAITAPRPPIPHLTQSSTRLHPPTNHKKESPPQHSTLQTNLREKEDGITPETEEA